MSGSSKLNAYSLSRRGVVASAFAAAGLAAAPRIPVAAQDTDWLHAGRHLRDARHHDPLLVL